MIINDSSEVSYLQRRYEGTLLVNGLEYLKYTIMPILTSVNDSVYVCVNKLDNNLTNVALYLGNDKISTMTLFPDTIALTFDSTGVYNLRMDAAYFFNTMGL